MYSRLFYLILGVFIFSVSSRAEQPVVGRKAAQKYFQEGKAEVKEALSPKGENLLMLHYAVFTSSTSYSWSWPQVNNPGQNSYGLTYLLEEWNGMDLNLRADYVTYSIYGTNAQKISLMPLLIFPRAETRFPLYFGAGIGGGIFTQQLVGASSFSLDYEVVAGARFLDLYKGVGTFLELAMKNHFLILSSGQFIGYSAAAGLVFNF